MSTRYNAGLYAGGRVPGNININTMTELEIFQALCDAHDSSTAQYPNPWYTQPDVQAVFGNLVAARGAANPALPPQLAGEGSPFKSFSAASTLPPPPAAGTQVSFNDTWFRPGATGRSLFTPPSAITSPNAHPYWQSSLLQKIYNNVTTTSNVFAIWWTVGYFEVVDESVMPPRLGQEIGRDQNRHIRHRFFAVVDRSGLQLFNATATANKAGTIKLTANQAVPQTLTFTYNPANVSGVTGPIPAWSARRIIFRRTWLRTRMPPITRFSRASARRRRPPVFGCRYCNKACCLKSTRVCRPPRW